MNIADVNEKFAIVGIGNKMCVMEFAADGSIVELWDYDNFRKKLVKEQIKTLGANGKLKVEPLADVWLRHRDGRQFERLVYSMPGSPQQAGPNDYNGWQGFRVEPAKGDWSRNRDHLKTIVCGGNEEHARWVLNWLAALVQRPGRHAWTAIVMRGGQGIGKGHFADKMIGKLFGPQQYIHILGSGQLTADFNEHLSGKVLIFADESTWGGEHKAASRIKGLITEDTVPINRKFLKMIDEPSMLHIIIASNNEWPIPIDAGDRRFTVFDVDPRRKQDQAYFHTLLSELDNGGRAAMLYDLLEMEIDDVALRTPLMTAAKSEIAVQSLKPIEHWWLEILERGTFDGSPWPTYQTKTALHDHYVNFLSKHYKTHRERLSTSTELGMFLRKFSIAIQQMTVNDRLERVAYLPSLSACRAEWSRVFHWSNTHEWDRDLAAPEGVGEAWEPPDIVEGM